MVGWLRRYWWAATAAVVALGIGLGFLVAGSSNAARALPPPRARIYTSFDACLLTDSAGIGSAQATPVWSGMQAASVRTSGKVSFLSVYGPDTPGNALTYVNTLASRKCDLVLAVGASEAAAARRQAGLFPQVRFVVIDAGTSADNVTAVRPGKDAEVSSSVEDIVVQAAKNISVR
jgi:basic membrane lipoprotein Med (substrate-binding protein (PBP1-ABC) superfamily)